MSSTSNFGGCKPGLSGSLQILCWLCHIWPIWLQQVKIALLRNMCVGPLEKPVLRLELEVWPGDVEKFATHLVVFLRKMKQRQQSISHSQFYHLCDLSPFLHQQYEHGIHTIWNLMEFHGRFFNFNLEWPGEFQLDTEVLADCFGRGSQGSQWSPHGPPDVDSFVVMTKCQGRERTHSFLLPYLISFMNDPAWEAGRFGEVTLDDQAYVIFLYMVHQ